MTPARGSQITTSPGHTLSRAAESPWFRALKNCAIGSAWPAARDWLRASSTAPAKSGNQGICHPLSVVAPLTGSDLTWLTRSFPSRRNPFIGIAFALDMAKAWERHVVGVDQQLLVRGAGQNCLAAHDRARRVVVPRRAPSRMTDLQRIVEGVAYTQKPLALAFQQDRGVPGRMARSRDRMNPREDLALVVERSHPCAEEPQRFDGFRSVRIVAR